MDGMSDVEDAKDDQANASTSVIVPKLPPQGLMQRYQSLFHDSADQLSDFGR